MPSEKTSAWDAYVGMTPFDDMAGLVEAGAIEPWDGHIPPVVLDDIDPAIRRECTLGGKLYAWPFLLDVTLQGWNAELVERADLDPGKPPASWDEYIASARTVRRSGAAPYGCTFDARPWRSLVPITYSFSTDVYTEDGLFDYTHAAVVEALEVLRRMFELANPDVLDPSTTAGAASTTDEGRIRLPARGLLREVRKCPHPCGQHLARSESARACPAAFGGGWEHVVLDDERRIATLRRRRRRGCRLRESAHVQRRRMARVDRGRPTGIRAAAAVHVALGRLAAGRAGMGAGMGVTGVSPTP